MTDAGDRPELARGVRLRWDPVRGQHFLLYPEGALVLNASAVAVLELCDGMRSRYDIAGELTERFDGEEVADDVEELLTSLAARGLVVDAGT